MYVELKYAKIWARSFSEIATVEPGYIPVYPGSLIVPWFDILNRTRELLGRIQNEPGYR